MSVFFRNSGLILLAAVIAAHIAQAAKPEWTIWNKILTPQNLQFALAGAGILLALALLSILFKPVEKAVKGNRCARCGKPIPKGDIYCADHLKEVVTEFREKNR